MMDDDIYPEFDEYAKAVDDATEQLEKVSITFQFMTDEWTLVDWLQFYALDLIDRIKDALRRK